MNLALSQNDMDDLRKQGYTDMEINTAVREVEKEQLNNSYQQTQQKRQNDPRQNSQISSFSARQDENIVRWQLELNDILERAEHILRGDVPEFTDGHIIWSKNPYPEENPINERGVAEILKILAMYVNRNTILSDYDNKEINIKVYDAGRDINNLVFMRYEDFGMDTEEKKKNYPIIVREIIDIIHSAYKRALDGSEKRSLREMISITQATTHALDGRGMTLNNQGQVNRERGLLNPMRYIKGKTVG
jgi:hypothetical protein